MLCPACSHDQDRVVDSRSTREGAAIRRRRECSVCGTRFTTFERIEQRLPWVTKKSGGRQPFSRDKVLHGIALACRKRPVSPEEMERAVRQVEQRLVALREPEVTSDRVGEAVMNVLRDLDHVAYVRFASVYQQFDSIEQFAELVTPLRES